MSIFYVYLAYMPFYNIGYPHDNYWYCDIPFLQIQTYLKSGKNFLHILALKGLKKETEAMFPSSLRQSIDSPKIQATPEKVREMQELLGMDLCNIDKYTPSSDLICY